MAREVTGKESGIVYLIPPGKIRCCVTGNLRKDTPEENVRQRWARSLVEEYGYPKTDIGIEIVITMGRQTKLGNYENCSKTKSRRLPG